MKKSMMIMALTGLAVALMVVQAGASLVPMSWGLPQMVQSNTLTAFQKDSAIATDDEASAIAFPTTASSITDGVFASSAFPTISQTAVQSNMLNSVKFQNENAFSAFAYPFLSIGGSPIPSMGFL
ncbi:MAG: hypothetical protein WBZ29_06720 [Methanocella sp.]